MNVAVTCSDCFSWCKMIRRLFNYKHYYVAFVRTAGITVHFGATWKIGHKMTTHDHNNKSKMDCMTVLRSVILLPLFVSTPHIHGTFRCNNNLEINLYKQNLRVETIQWLPFGLGRVVYTDKYVGFHYPFLFWYYDNYELSTISFVLETLCRNVWSARWRLKENICTGNNTEWK